MTSAERPRAYESVSRGSGLETRLGQLVFGTFQAICAESQKSLSRMGSCTKIIVNLSDSRLSKMCWFSAFQKYMV